MDELMKTVNRIVDSIGRSQLIRYVMIYMLVVGVVSLCGGVLLFLGGVAAGIGGLAGAAVLSQAGSTADTQQAAQAAGTLVAASGFLVIYGILSIITGPAMIIVGLGLRNRASWSRMGVVIVGSLSILTSLIGLFTGGGLGGGIFSLLWLVIDAFVVYIFYSDAGIKSEFAK
jgi:hypothetical protein